MKTVYTLLVQVGRCSDDGLADDASGAAFLVFAPALDPDQAVRETVQLMKASGLNPLEVMNHGSIDERRAEGYEFSDSENELAQEAIDQDAVIILDKQLIFDAAELN